MVNKVAQGEDHSQWNVQDINKLKSSKNGRSSGSGEIKSANREDENDFLDKVSIDVIFWNLTSSDLAQFVSNKKLPMLDVISLH